MASSDVPSMATTSLWAKVAAASPFICSVCFLAISAPLSMRTSRRYKAYPAVLTKLHGQCPFYILRAVIYNLVMCLAGKMQHDDGLFVRTLDGYYPTIGQCRGCQPIPLLCSLFNVVPRVLHLLRC